MDKADSEKLFRDVMRQPPAEKLKLAGMLLLMDPTKAGMAVSIAKRAIEEIELALLLGEGRKR